MSVESAILSNVLRNGDEALVYLIEHGVKAEFFHEERSLMAYRWLVEEWGIHGEMPSEERFGRQFPTFIFAAEPDPLSALVEELRANHAIHLARDMFPGIAFEFEKGPERLDLTMITGQLSTLLEKVSEVRSVNEVALLSEKMGAFLEDLLTMDGSELSGIPTGFHALDMASGGWQAENFGVIGAAPKRFKTAILMWMALAAAACRVPRHGLDVRDVDQRVDAAPLLPRRWRELHAHPARHADKRERRKLEDFRDDFKSWDGDIELIHDVAAVTTISGLAAQIRSRSRKPDIVFIDGLYQMHDDSREWDTDAGALTAVCRGLKRLAAAERIPIIGTTQALLARISGRRGTEMGSLGYTSAFAQDANVILGIDRPDMSSNDITLKVIGARSMAGMAVDVTVDLDIGTIIEGGEYGVDCRSRLPLNRSCAPSACG